MFKVWLDNKSYQEFIFAKLKINKLTRGFLEVSPKITDDTNFEMQLIIVNQLVSLSAR